MTCNDVEIMIQNNDITEDINNHLLTCHSCQLYKELFSFTPENIVIGVDIDASVNEAIIEAEIIKKKNNILSLLLFIVISSSLISSILILNLGSIEIILKRYVLIVSAIMPFSLPVIAFIRRKVVSNGH